MNITFGGYLCLDPRDLARAFADNHLPPGLWYGKANSYVCPLGEEAGVANLLMYRDDYAKLDLTGVFSLVFDDGSTAVVDGDPGQQKKVVNTGRQEFKNLKVLRASVEDSPLTGPAFVHVVAEDWRGYLRPALTSSDRFTSNNSGSAFNYLHPNSTQFAPQTLTEITPTGNVYTWHTMLVELWARAYTTTQFLTIGPDAFGNYSYVYFKYFFAFPGLPFVPQGVPMCFDYTTRKWGAWNAINDVLTRLGCAIKFDPVAEVVTIVRLGVASAAGRAATAAVPAAAVVARSDAGSSRAVPIVYVAFDKFIDDDFFSAGESPGSYRGPKRYSAEYIAPGLTYLPNAAAERVVVRDDNYGSGWHFNTEEINSKLGLFQQLPLALNPAWYDSDARTLERVTDYRRIYAAFDGPKGLTFAGVWPSLVAALGSEYDAIAFHDRGAGIVTELRATRKPLERIEAWTPPRPEVLAPPQYWPAVRSFTGTLATGTLVVGGMLCLPTAGQLVVHAYSSVAAPAGTAYTVAVRLANAAGTALLSAGLFNKPLGGLTVPAATTATYAVSGGGGGTVTVATPAQLAGVALNYSTEFVTFGNGETPAAWGANYVVVVTYTGSAPTATGLLSGAAATYMLPPATAALPNPPAPPPPPPPPGGPIIGGGGA